MTPLRRLSLCLSLAYLCLRWAARLTRWADRVHRWAVAWERECYERRRIAWLDASQGERDRHNRGR